MGIGGRGLESGLLSDEKAKSYGEPNKLRIKYFFS